MGKTTSAKKASSFKRNRSISRAFIPKSVYHGLCKCQEELNVVVLIKPQKYYIVANIEDRLFIPEEYVPLFVEAGWKRQK
jgi:hypothetical protein